MTYRRVHFGYLLGLVVGCGGGTQTQPPPTNLACDAPIQLALTVGEHQVLDPSSSKGCVRLTAPGAAAEYLVVATSTSGLVVTGGVGALYTLRTGPAGSLLSSPSAVAAQASLTGPGRLTVPERFDAMLRQRERDLAQNPSRFFISPPVGAPKAPPAVGDRRDFQVCKDLQCNTFATVPATARSVGQHVAVYLEDSSAVFPIPATDTLEQADLDDFRDTFDTYHYPIDNTAFGQESDIDNNGVVDILLTTAVNRLTPDCTNGRVIGYFFGGDLSTTLPNSNKAEVFYGFAPSAATAKCPSISRQQAVDRLKPTLIHEFQHMISYNQHALQRQGAGEVTWLNEALSHYAEELGGHLIPANECPRFSSCRSQYISPDLFNAYDYLSNTEGNFLVYPQESSGTLAERGASWMFVRWLTDQFGSDSLGTNVTRALDGTSAVGAENVSAVVGAEFATLVTQWQLANYLTDLTGFSATSARLSYKTWGFRKVYTDPRNVQAFPAGFPLKPDTATGAYSHSGTLRGGSGRHLLIEQAVGSAVDLQLKSSTGGALGASVGARLGIVRIR